ncbi:MAG: hypothetical protein DSY60_04960 [Persephonella sp.]|nr:MAG: hypothetical protein DSY60_04960 [Persephonella sp.]
MMVRIKERLFEIKLEIKLFLRFLPLSVILLVMGGFLIIYNTHYIKVDNEIIRTSQNILTIQESILNLKKEKSKLISPKNIESRAKEELNMVNVNLEKVRFLVNE